MYLTNRIQDTEFSGQNIRHRLIRLSGKQEGLDWQPLFVVNLKKQTQSQLAPRVTLEVEKTKPISETNLYQ
jgi:hypothetical protein